jgi:hypothetical protein
MAPAHSDDEQDDDGDETEAYAKEEIRHTQDPLTHRALLLSPILETLWPQASRASRQKRRR